MDNNWNTCTIKELAEKVGMGPFGSSIKVETFVDSGIPVISGMHLKGIKLEDSNFNFITVEHADKLANANVYRGDVIFTHAGNIGAVAYIPYNSKYERYILSQRQFYLRCDKQKLLPEFITYFFKSPIGQQKLLANTSSSGVPSISQPVTYLRSIEVEAPNVNEQERIVSILSSLDDKIELNIKMNQTLESIAKAIFKRWFVDFQFPGATGEMVNDLPEGWRIGNLDNVIDLVYGKGLKEENRVQGKYPVVGSNGIVGYHNQFLVEGPGIVIGRKGTIGEVIWIEENFSPIDTTFYIKDVMGLKELYFHYYLLLQQDFKKITSDSAVPGLNRNSALSTEVIIPPVDVIAKFNHMIRPLFNKIQHNIFTNNILIKIRDSLLPKLITGQIPVNQ